MKLYVKIAMFFLLLISIIHEIYNLLVLSIEPINVVGMKYNVKRKASLHGYINI